MTPINDTPTEAPERGAHWLRWVTIAVLGLGLSLGLALPAGASSAAPLPSSSRAAAATPTGNSWTAISHQEASGAVTVSAARSSRLAATSGDIHVPGVPGAFSIDFWTKGFWKVRVPVGYHLRFSPAMQGYIAKNGLKFLDSMVCSGIGAERLGIIGEVAKKICEGYHKVTNKLIETASQNIHPRCWVEFTVLMPPLNTVVGVNDQWRCPS